jgi:hypothetical protein
MVWFKHVAILLYNDFSLDDGDDLFQVAELENIYDLTYLSVDDEGLWSVEKVADEVPPFDEIMRLGLRSSGMVRW